jgi:hypothetical protein
MKIFNKFAGLLVFFLFGHSSLLASPKSLCINLMWLNRDVGTSITDRVRPDPKQVAKSWFSKNPEDSTAVFFWYDSSKIWMDKDTVSEHEKNGFLDVLSENEKNRFSLRDMQELESVKNNPDLFGRTPIYLQADVLRFLLAKELIDTKQCETVLYADLNVEPQNRQDLFDDRTIEFLNEYGFVNLRHRAAEHSTGGYNGFENKMLIMQKNDYLWQAFDVALIEPLKEGVKRYSKNLDKMNQKVYGQIPILFAYILSLKGRLTLENVEGFLRQNIWERSGGAVIDNRTGTKILFQNIGQVTKNYYYTDDDLESLFQDLKTEWEVRLPEAEEQEKETRDTIANLKKKTSDDRIKKAIERQENKLEKLTLEIELLRKNIQDLATEEGKQATIEKIKNQIRDELQKSEWPHDLPVPAKRMVAPGSHFG